MHGVAGQRPDAGADQLGGRHDVLDRAAVDAHVGGVAVLVVRGAGPGDRERVGAARVPQRLLLGVVRRPLLIFHVSPRGGGHGLEPLQQLGVGVEVAGEVRVAAGRRSSAGGGRLGERGGERRALHRRRGGRRRRGRRRDEGLERGDARHRGVDAHARSFGRQRLSLAGSLSGRSADGVLAPFRRFPERDRRDQPHSHSPAGPEPAARRGAGPAVGQPAAHPVPRLGPQQPEPARADRADRARPHASRSRSSRPARRWRSRSSATGPS